MKPLWGKLQSMGPNPLRIPFLSIRLPQPFHQRFHTGLGNEDAGLAVDDRLLGTSPVEGNHGAAAGLGLHCH
jgi:hypothetical protein